MIWPHLSAPFARMPRDIRQHENAHPLACKSLASTGKLCVARWPRPFTSPSVSHAGNYEGELAAGENAALFAEGGMGAVPQREADLLHLWTAYERAADPVAKSGALAALDAAIDGRRRTDDAVRGAVWDLLRRPAVLSLLQACMLFPDTSLLHLLTVSPAISARLLARLRHASCLLFLLLSDAAWATFLPYDIVPPKLSFRGSSEHRVTIGGMRAGQVRGCQPAAAERGAAAGQLLRRERCA